MRFSSHPIFPFAIWLLLTISILVPFLLAATDVVPVKDDQSVLGKMKRSLLPGQTTHGHYQIELECSACHQPDMRIKAGACNDCHGEELKQAHDTHAAKKFKDPSNAQRLETLNVMECTTCHREHVPEQTSEMGLSLPQDYCYHCHQDIFEQRPSHKDFAFDSCNNAGCHNFHDNRALFEKFLDKHSGEPDFLDLATIPELSSEKNEYSPADRLTAKDQDAPEGKKLSDDDPLLQAWVDSAHAEAGVGCTKCHGGTADDQQLVNLPSGDEAADAVDPHSLWSRRVSYETCGKCHEQEVSGWLQSRHGMRLAAGLSAMTPEQARLPMKAKVAHEALDCSSCHQGHRFDRQFAAYEACISCHDDSHSRAYAESTHFELWQAELAGDAPAGTGVSCATCHMPHIEVDGKLVVQHNQNDNLRPSDKMVRNACINCHGLEFSLSCVADKQLIKSCFQGQPAEINQSVKMAAEWFEAKRRKREARKKSAKKP